MLTRNGLCNVFNVAPIQMSLNVFTTLHQISIVIKEKWLSFSSYLTFKLEIHLNENYFPRSNRVGSPWRQRFKRRPSKNSVLHIWIIKSKPSFGLQITRKKDIHLNATWYLALLSILLKRRGGSSIFPVSQSLLRNIKYFLNT